jgi:hypothetical protein
MPRIVHFRRGAAGWLFEIVFYLFNLAMLVAVLLTIARSGNILAEAEGAIARGLAGFGAATRLFILVLAWTAGDVILGALTIIARSRTAVIEE